MAGPEPRATIPLMTPGHAVRPRPGAPVAALLTLLIAVLGVAACFPPMASPASPGPSRAPTVPPSAAARSASPSVAPSASPAASVDPASVYARIEPQVVAIRSLTPKHDVNPKVLSVEELKAHVAESFKKDNPPALVAANERLLKGLGLLPANASLSDLYIELLGSQVAGFYSPDDKELYVVSRTGGIGPLERVTFAHEYTHALQDQTFDLAKLHVDEVGQGDRGLARLSLIEGDAVAVQSVWTQRNLTAAENIALLQAALDPEALKILEKMPPILRESLTFPYDNGLRFVMGLQSRRGWAGVDAAYAKPPASTEQVLHPEKYDAGEAPVAVDIPDDLATRMGSGWKSTLEDTFGEFQLGVWLRGAVDSAADATAAAAGWGGDRIEVLEGPNGAWGIALITDWDTVADAQQFGDAAVTAAAKLPSAAMESQPGSKRVTVLVGSDDAVLTKLESILGHTGA
jgi:hypothetical protein